jgi:metallo-beta-lactamase class B
MIKRNRFGNTSPPDDFLMRPYMLAEEPFRIAGNLYFVGNSWCSSHMIDTGEGLILIDTPCGTQLPYLIDSIWRAGFDPKDLKYIIVSHAHVDHYGTVNALVRMSGARTFMSMPDAADMRDNKEKFIEANKFAGGFNENFIADVEINDGDNIELGNTKIRCVLTPGHTVGTMSDFWELEDNGRKYNVGIYGGAGFIALSPERIESGTMPAGIRELFSQSIEKVWNEQVDIMLGNHPCHNDTFAKRDRVLAGEKDAFIDPSEWHRFLQELRVEYAAFCKLTQEEIDLFYKKSDFFKFRNLWKIQI